MVEDKMQGYATVFPASLRTVAKQLEKLQQRQI